MALVWVLALLIAVAYYRWTPFAESLVGLRLWKAQCGLWFAAGAGMVAGGILPELARLATGALKRPDAAWLADTLFRGVVWSGLGVMVDVFYSCQAHWFGTSIAAYNVVRKTAVDMFVFAPTVFVPYTVGMFVWRADHYRPRSLLTVWTPKGWVDKVLPTYVPNVLYWIPVLFAVYAMPTDLQYPMSALATACWSLVFAFLNRCHGAKTDGD